MTRASASAGAALLAVAALLAGACELEFEGEEDDDDDGSATHRPGQACLRCHDFALAGTVYARAGDSRGAEGVEVVMTDAAGHQFTALSNRAGNFMVSVDADLAAPVQRSSGRLRIPWRPVYPVSVTLRGQGVEKRMRSVIHREGSCAVCHDRAGPGAASAGTIWLLEGAP